MRMSSMRGRMPGILGSTALAVVLAAGRTGALGPRIAILPREIETARPFSGWQPRLRPGGRGPAGPPHSLAGR